MASLTAAPARITSGLSTAISRLNPKVLPQEQSLIAPNNEVQDVRTTTSRIVKINANGITNKLQSKKSGRPVSTEHCQMPNARTNKHGADQVLIMASAAQP